MKKVNSMKKIISTGLAMLMLVSVVGTTQCSAKTSSTKKPKHTNSKCSTGHRRKHIRSHSKAKPTQKQTQKPKQEIKTNPSNGYTSNDSLSDNTQNSSEVKNIKTSSGVKKKGNGNRRKIMNKLAERQAKKDAKAEKFVKVVAVAALAGAAGYTCYKYQDDIKSAATTVGNYIVTKAPKVLESTKSAAKTAGAYIATNGQKAWESTKSAAKIAGEKILNGVKAVSQAIKGQ